MTRPDPNLERLNAYVDGELDAAETARVATEVAADRETAAVVAGLSRAKFGVKNAFDDTEHRIELQVAPRRRRAYVAAAVLAGAFVVSAAAWTLYGSAAPDDSIMAMALDDHDAWVAEPSVQADPAAAPVNVVVPDLTAAGLKVSQVRTSVNLGNVLAAQVTYLGVRGCRLSLYAYPSGTRTAPLNAGDEPDALIASWTAGAKDYLLVARRMNNIRFEVIAAALQEATLRLSPASDETRVAMNAARQPCRS